MTVDLGISADDAADDAGPEGQRFGFALSTESPRVLVVDDERVIREMLSDFLGLEGYVVRTVEDGAQALEELQRRSYNLVISDLKMPNMSGLELIEKITELGLPVLTVIMTGFGTVETAIEAMKHGAYDYVLKPFRVEEVVHTVQRGLDRQRLQHENLRLKDALSIYKISEAIATSLSVERVLDLVLEAVLDAVNADVANLLLERPESNRRPGDPPGPFVEHARKVSPRLGPADTAPPLNLAEVLPLFQEDKPLLAHGARAHRFLLGLPENRLVSFCSIPLKLKGRIIGMLSAYSYTRGHSERVSTYARLIAMGMRMPEAQIETIVKVGLLHDVGKIGIRNDRLNKPGKLTPEELAMFRSHPAKGKRILEPIPFMRDIVPGCYCHHEAWDGSGYPQGLRADGIPLIGRIIAVADAYDAMTTDRAYRQALPHVIACGELERCSGTQFDPEIVRIFLVRIEEHRKLELLAGRNVPR